MFEPIILVHGGCGMIPSENDELVLDGVKAAARQGHIVFTRGGNAVDAVVAAVTSLEDNPLFNAGLGSALNLKGEVEADAIVIDGHTLDSGGVCGLKACANPVQVAKLVMDKTSHCLLTGEGAVEFMKSQGICSVPNSKLVTPKRQAQLDEYLTSTPSAEMNVPASPAASAVRSCDTVGAVAMDAEGNLAAATSTGGTIGKLPGRVGDSPVIGSGAYADSSVGAVSTTGDGEYIMRVCLARRICEHLEQGESVDQACEKSLEFMTKRIGGTAGAIVLARDGERGKCQMGHIFNTECMPWAAVSAGQITWGMKPGQKLSASLEEPA